MLEVKGLWAGYSSPVLQGVSFSVAQGELAAILGRNGSGKSTLLRALTGSAKVSQGQVLIQGRDCLPLSARQRARHMALLPQVIAPSSGLRAEEIIEMGRYPWESPLRPGGARSRQLVHQAAREFGVEHLLDQDCSVLSQGQRQLVQLARVVVQDAPVLLLDEPNSAPALPHPHLPFGAGRPLRPGGAPRPRPGSALVQPPVPSGGGHHHGGDPAQNRLRPGDPGKTGPPVPWNPGQTGQGKRVFLLYH